VVSSGLSSPWGVAVDGDGNVYVADNGSAAIKKLLHAFVDPTPKLEPLAGGSDALSTVLPATTDLLPPFAPIYSQPWMTNTAGSNGVVKFNCAASTTNRTGSITLLGQTIPVFQFDVLLNTNVLFVGSGGGSTNVVLTVNPRATQAWTASSPASWLHPDASGSGSGVVNITFDTNHALSRFAILTIAGQTVTVIQSMGIADASVLIQPTIMGDGSFQFNFTNVPNASFTALFSTNPSLPLNLWTPIGTPTENPPGQYQFNDPAPANPQGFYNIRSP
jgi:hypothetical protein